MPALKRKVGLVVLTKVNGVIYAVNQVRGRWNHEKMVLESWPGLNQVFVHGGLNDGEDVLDGLFREVGEEAGGAVRAMVDDKRDKLVPLTGKNDENQEVHTFGVFLPSSFIPMIRLGPSSGGIRLVAADEYIQSGTGSSNKTDGIMDASQVVMFEDEAAATAEAFRKVPLE